MKTFRIKISSWFCYVQQTMQKPLQAFEGKFAFDFLEDWYKQLFRTS